MSVSRDSSEEELTLLRAFLAGRDIECPQCRYNLRDLPGDRCPECGEHLVLRVNLVEPKLAAPIAGVVALASGAGLNGLLLLYWLIMITFYRRNGDWMNRFVFVNLVNLAIVGGALALWLRNWRKIRAASPKVRWWLAAACGILSLLDLIIFTVVIR